MKRMIALLLACSLFWAQAALAEAEASTGADERLIALEREGEGIGENVREIVLQTEDAVYYVRQAEDGDASKPGDLWMYADGAAVKLSELGSNAVYAEAEGAIYFLSSGEAPRLMALDVAAGQVEEVAEPDLEGVEPTDLEIALVDGGVAVYPRSQPEERVIVDAWSAPSPVPAAAESSPAPDENLSRGSKGEEVRSLQQRLYDLGYPVGARDGVFGYRTYQAVRYFQDALGADQTGEVTPELEEEIFSEGAPEYRQYVALSRGSHGIRVEALQSRLRALSYPIRSVDGDYGSGTAEAVRLFQRKAGLSQTGSASVSTLKALMAKGAPAYSEYVRLSKGDTGNRVKKLQERLYKLGYYAGARGGTYDARTAEAIKLFQSALGLKQTGEANEKLQKRLYASDAPKCKAYIELKYGDTGARVKELQKRLKALGYFGGEIGGHFQSQTRGAVKAFQEALGVKQTGVASVSLQKKLFADEAPPATP